MKNSFKIGLLLICITGLFGFTQIKAQNLSGHIWIFPDSCGIDFRDTSNVIPFFGTRSAWGSGGGISSALGQFAFYTDGSRILDNYHQYVLNFDSTPNTINPSRNFFFPSSTDSSIFYMYNSPFASPFVSCFKLEQTFPISTFIDSYQIEVPNFYSTTATYYQNHGIKSLKQDAVRHGNGRDWWIVASMGSSSVYTDSFVIFSFYNDSLRLSHYLTSGIKMYQEGELDISKDGSKVVVCAADSFRVYEWDFDRCSATLSNMHEVYNPHQNFYNNFPRRLRGISYSKNMDYIYGCTVDTLYQFNPRATIDSLKYTIIWYDTNNVILGDTTSLINLELGEDGNIYVGYKREPLIGNFGYQPIESYIGIIKNADSPYPICYFEPYGLFLGTQCQSGINNYLPSVPNYNLGPLIGSPCDTLTTTSTGQWLSPAAQVKVFPNPANDKINITWPVQGGYTWALKSLAGSTLSSGTQQAGNATISTATLPEGMYFLEVHSSKEHKVEKVIISEK